MGSRVAFCRAFALALVALAHPVIAQTFNCTVSCTIVSDAFPLPPIEQPTQCRLFDGATLLVSALVVASGPGVACRFPQTFAEGRTVSLTAKGVYSSGDSAASFPPVVFTSSAGLPNPTITGFVATPSTIAAGASSVLSATVANATSTQLDGAPVSLPATVTPPATHTYTLTASGPAGTTPATAQTTVTVTTGPPPTTITMGETAILPNLDSGNANIITAQNATLAQSGTLVSMSFYVSAVGGNVRLGIYDSTGPSGGPGAKKAESASFVAAAGWNTVTMPSVALPSGVYWLAFVPSSGALSFRKDVVAGISGKFYTIPFGTLPVTFSPSASATGSHYSLYATLNTGAAPVLPPPTNVRLSP